MAYQIYDVGNQFQYSQKCAQFKLKPMGSFEIFNETRKKGTFECDVVAIEIYWQFIKSQFFPFPLN